MPSLGMIIQIAVAVVGAYLVALWFSLIVWTFRDIQSRSDDILAVALATMLVITFTLPGLLLYLILRPKETLVEAYERSLEEEYLLQDIERDICYKCKQRVEQDFLICPSCHVALKKPCRSCGRLLNLNWRTCPYCGSEATDLSVSETRAVRSFSGG
ncbi:MAG: zinc ribbon domain-containing protein [Chloroflexi bacterium]|nr:zinc ribbon domain-containing protein [Chloroflexota bacterium]